jgi:hypothetical protein
LQDCASHLLIAPNLFLIYNTRLGMMGLVYKRSFTHRIVTIAQASLSALRKRIAETDGMAMRFCEALDVS